LDKRILCIQKIKAARSGKHLAKLDGVTFMMTSEISRTTTYTGVVNK
jgi:hypothetical protein